MDDHLSLFTGSNLMEGEKNSPLPFRVMVKNAYGCLMSLQCLLCRGLAGGEEDGCSGSPGWGTARA